MGDRARNVLPSVKSATMAAFLAMALILPVPAGEPAVSGSPGVATRLVADNERECARYVVIGVRGSGQSMDGFLDMGPTVGPYGQAAFDNLPEDERSSYSLPYPATLPLTPEEYFSSVDQGVELLKSTVDWYATNCEGVNIGLIGYSQGAQVVSEAASFLEAAISPVYAILLLADPRSAGDSFYDRHSTITGGPGTHLGSGILGALALPPAYQSRATDFCITADPVCDAPEQWDLPAIIAAALFGFHLHTSYATCCGSADLHVPFRDILGRELALRLLGRHTPPPAQCAGAGPTRAVPAARRTVADRRLSEPAPAGRGLLAAIGGSGCGDGPPPGGNA